MIEVNGTIVLQVFNFLLLVYLLNRLLVKPLTNVVAERKRYIEEKQVKAETLVKECVERLSEYEAQIAMAKKRASDLSRELKEAGEEERKIMLVRASEEGERIVEKVMKELEHELAEAKKNLEAQIEDMVLMVAAKVLGRKV